MADLGAALLRAALGYARARVLELLDPDPLAAALGVPIPAGVRDQVIGHLAQAQTRADQLAATLAGPVTHRGRAGGGRAPHRCHHPRARPRPSCSVPTTAPTSPPRSPRRPGPLGLAAQLGLDSPHPACRPARPR